MKDKYLIKILEEYVNLYRKLVNEKNFSKPDKDIRELLKLNEDDDWVFICSAMDSIADTCLAIDNFYEFGLYGPTKYSNKGERYLRLFGILNSIYIQKEAIINLYKYNGVPDYKTPIKKINNMEIISIRNKLASHNNNFIRFEEDDKKLISYGISEINEYSCLYYANDSEIKIIDIDLHFEINEYMSYSIILMEKVCEKSIKTIYKNNKIKIDEYNEEIELIKKAKDNKTTVERQLSLKNLSDRGILKIIE